MADENPFEGDPFEGNPFRGMPFFDELSKLLGAMSGSNWNQTRQLAVSMAAGTGEPNVDPGDRIAFETLARVAEMHVTQQSGLVVSPTGILAMRPATRAEWAAKTVDQYRTYLEIVGSSLGSSVTLDTGSDIEAASQSSDPSIAALGAVMGMLGPMMVSVTAGSMVGHLAQRSFGYYDLPLPRPDVDEILVVNANIEAFIAEWELPKDDVRMWVALHELAHHAVLRVPHVGERFRDLITDYASHFSADSEAIAEQFGDVNMQDFSSISAMQERMGDPEAFLVLLQSDRQREVQPFIAALLAVIEGYVDWILDGIGTRLMASYPLISEAMRRRRVTAAPADRFVERIFGIELDARCFDRGTAFIDGVIKRSGEAALSSLWTAEDNLPTPAEVDAPGLWLARLGLPNTEIEPADIDLSDLDDFDIDDL